MIYFAAGAKHKSNPYLSIVKVVEEAKAAENPRTRV
jgi:hypothetical protein